MSWKFWLALLTIGKRKTTLTKDGLDEIDDTINMRDYARDPYVAAQINRGRAIGKIDDNQLTHQSLIIP